MPVSSTELLRSASLRVTRPRVSVLDQLRARPHADADAIAADVRADIGSVSTQAVYDVLAALTAARIIRRVEPAGSRACYEIRTDNHHHLVCRSCSIMIDVECAVGEAPCLDVTEAAGFAIDEAEITYWGLCPQCQQRPEASSNPSVLISISAPPPQRSNA